VLFKVRYIMGACLNTPAPSKSANAPKPEDANATESNKAIVFANASSSPVMQAAPQEGADAADQGKFKIQELEPSTEAEFKKKYVLKGVLGSGNYSVVRKAMDLTTNEAVAVKVVDGRKLTKEDEATLKVEVNVLSALNHPNIIKLHGWYVEGKNYYIVTELMNGGELFDRIVKKEFYSEADAQKVVMTLAMVVKYIHDKDIVHRDLKPENILLTDDTDQAQIKIADFGFARPVGGGLGTACGTPGYVAPEIINGKPYGKSVDIWSLGVIIYILLCGYPPFYHQTQTQLFKTIRKGRFAFDSPYWDPIGENAKNLIRGCLTVDVNKRLDVDGVLRHQWLAHEAEAKNISSVLGELKKFNARRKLRAAIKAAIAANRLIDIAQLVQQSGK